MKIMKLSVRSQMCRMAGKHLVTVQCLQAAGIKAASLQWRGGELTSDLFRDKLIILMGEGIPFQEAKSDRK